MKKDLENLTLTRSIDGKRSDLEELSKWMEKNSDKDKNEEW